MSEQTSSLKPCPFCGSSDIDAEGWANSEGVKGPACNDCNASAGEVSKSTADNIAAWNTRVSQGEIRELSQQEFADSEGCMRMLADAYHNFPGYWDGTIGMALSGPQLREHWERVYAALKPYLKGEAPPAGGIRVPIATHGNGLQARAGEIVRNARSRKELVGEIARLLSQIDDLKVPKRESGGQWGKPVEVPGPQSLPLPESMKEFGKPSQECLDDIAKINRNVTK